MTHLDRRATLFPRSKPATRAPKRALTDQVSSDKSNPKLRRMVPVRGFKKAVENPWERYNGIFEFDQAGPVTLAHIKNASFEEFVVKPYKANNKACLSEIKDCSHKNIVRLHEVLYHDGSLYFFYEVMEVSLAQIFATPLGRLKPYEVAAFCTDILHGLEFLHNSLQLVHGDVNANNVLLSTNGAVKIANVGSSMLQKVGQKTVQDDNCGVGKLMLMCLEPGTFLKNDDDLQEDWNVDLKAFHQLTKSKSSSELLQHNFLKLSPGSKCLIPYIRIAREMASKRIEII